MYVPAVAGLTERLVPVPAKVPPHELVYHFQLAPAPNLPPLNVRVLVWPKQMVEVPLILEAGSDVSLMVKVMLAHAVMLQPFKPLTYMVWVPRPSAAVVSDNESPDPKPTCPALP